MSWTLKVRCVNPICSATVWRVVKGVWTCQCGTAMSSAAIAAYHATLCNCATKDRVVVDGQCQTCQRSLT